MSEQNEIIEDIAIREAIDSIYDMLAELPKEKRLAFFEQISKPKELDFVKEIDGIYYVILSHSIGIKMMIWWTRSIGY